MLIVGEVPGLFFLKPDSALGRLFLWKITCQAITKYPGDVIRDSLLLMVRRRKLIFPREIMPSGRKGDRKSGICI